MQPQTHHANLNTPCQPIRTMQPKHILCDTKDIMKSQRHHITANTTYDSNPTKQTFMRYFIINTSYKHIKPCHQSPQCHSKHTMLRHIMLKHYSTQHQTHHTKPNADGYIKHTIANLTKSCKPKHTCKTQNLSCQVKLFICRHLQRG